MTFLPIVERELRVAARKRGTYRTRFLAVLIGTIICGWRIFESTRFGTTAMQGEIIFFTIIWITYFFCLCIGIWTTADCISEEKRDGTLGLLFLTDLKGYDVILGKLVARSLHGIYALVAIVPIIGVPFLMGGITAPQLLKGAAAVSATMLLSLGTGIFVSSLNTHERKSIFYTILLLLILTAGPSLFFFLQTRPVISASSAQTWLFLLPCSWFTLQLGTAKMNFFPQQAYWISLTTVLLLAALVVRTGSIVIMRAWRNLALQREESEKVAEFLGQKKSRDSDYRRRLLNKNPYLWRASRDSAQRVKVWFFVLAMVGFWSIGYFIYGEAVFDLQISLFFSTTINTCLKCWIALEACMSVNADRKSGAFELLFSTPVQLKEVVAGQMNSLRRQFMGPGLLVLAFESLPLVIYNRHAPNLYINYPDLYSSIAAAIVVAVVDFFALSWVGIYLGLTSKSLTRAVITTIALILLVPQVLYWMIMWGTHFSRFEAIWSWILLSVGLDHILIFGWARPKLAKGAQALLGPKESPARFACISEFVT